MDAARSEAALRDLEAAALAEDHVVGRHAHVIEHDLGMAVRRVVVAEHAEHALDAHAGRIERHEDHRLLAMALRIRIGLAHDDRDPAARIADAGRPPFAPGDDVVPALAPDRGLDVGRIRRRDLRLGHQERRADVAREQGLEPPRLLLGRAVAVQHLHVPGVGRGAVEHFRREGHPPHLLREQRVGEVRQPRAAILRRVVMGRGWQEQVPEPGGARPRLQLLDERDRLPALARRDLARVALDVRRHVLRHEGADPVAPGGLFRRRGEIHQGTVTTTLPFTARSVRRRIACPPSASVKRSETTGFTFPSP